jgi:hypothetical protein
VNQFIVLDLPEPGDRWTGQHRRCSEANWAIYAESDISRAEFSVSAQAKKANGNKPQYAFEPTGPPVLRQLVRSQRAKANATEK